ncbi:DNA ligase 1 [Coraliomargarita akajimensis DSM 45221]|uniref:DNA ligase 1 n=1 Tax=Coraliomargarita akajimensis (strain DSM 45221 / IAM 15411 / JCM 23193 / KCTC 12865 / 04OKA010-24) TaxID=583355 RepID=D5EI20_CORAD|nr:DNA ligase 1 [Coraliomargarita akajimensis DSM 45221]
MPDSNTAGDRRGYNCNVIKDCSRPCPQGRSFVLLDDSLPQQLAIKQKKSLRQMTEALEKGLITLSCDGDEPSPHQVQVHPPSARKYLAQVQQ